MQFNSEKIITNFEPPISAKEYRQFTREKKAGDSPPAFTALHSSEFPGSRMPDPAI
jgi:hypothetical protein